MDTGTQVEAMDRRCTECHTSPSRCIVFSWIIFEGWGKKIESSKESEERPNKDAFPLYKSAVATRKWSYSMMRVYDMAWLVWWWIPLIRCPIPDRPLEEYGLAPLFSLWVKGTDWQWWISLRELVPTAPLIRWNHYIATGTCWCDSRFANTDVCHSSASPY